jgi:uncharacterized protein
VILPDANLLLYAYDASSPFHRKAAEWLTNTLLGPESVGFCVPVLFAFMRISTSVRAFTDPLSIEEAANHVSDWLDQPNAQLVEMQLRDVRHALALLRSAGTGGNLTTDAQVAAIALRLRAVVHTTDTDYARFRDLSWHNPLTG